MRSSQEYTHSRTLYPLREGESQSRTISRSGVSPLGSSIVTSRLETRAGHGPLSRRSSPFLSPAARRSSESWSPPAGPGLPLSPKLLSTLLLSELLFLSTPWQGLFIQAVLESTFFFDPDWQSEPPSLSETSQANGRTCNVRKPHSPVFAGSPLSQVRSMGKKSCFVLVSLTGRQAQTPGHGTAGTAQALAAARRHVQQVPQCQHLWQTSATAFKEQGCRGYSPGEARVS